MSRRVGITLVEILVVIVIIVAVAALLLPAASSARKSARSERDLASRTASSESREDSSHNKSLISDATAAQRIVPMSAGQVATSDNKGVVVPSQKIIFEAEISLVVDKFPETEAQLTRLLKQVGGYVAEATLDRTQGAQLSGRWRVRVPVDQFDSFLDAVSKFGVAESRHQTAQDVTAEFVDLGAQIANKKQLEQRIVELLKNSPGQIKDVIEVERELARVRGEIEQMEGRLRYLTNRTDYTTVAITAREEHDYVPPQAPTFSNQIKEAWGDSLQSLREFGERTVVASVSAFPWIAVVCVLVVPAWCIVKRAVARRSRARIESSPDSSIVE